MAEIKCPVLITGAGGFVGAHLACRLVAEGLDVIGTVREDGGGLRLQHLAPDLPTRRGDLTDKDFVTGLMRDLRPATVFHFASTPFNPPTIPLNTHVAAIIQATTNLLQAALDYPPQHWIHTTSALVYGEKPVDDEQSPLAPNSVYGAAKAGASLLAQTVARSGGLPVTELRLYTPYGPWERANRLIPTLLRRIDSGDAIHLQGGQQQRDYVYIDDVVAACRYAAARKAVAPAVYNIGAGRGVAIAEIAHVLMELCGRTVPIQIDGAAMRADEILEMAADIRAAARDLAWQPQVALRDGLQRTIDWFLAHKKIAPQLR